MDNINDELFQRNLISDNQFVFLESIRTNKIISVNFELRLILYLGILLFTGGVGYFAYENMSSIGHLSIMILLCISIIVGFYFIKKRAKPYSNFEVTISHLYFDYILILVSLLIITLFTYVQVYFDLVELLINSTSFISAALFFYMAYRYDNRALLSMAITVLSAAVGLTISPVSWVKSFELSSHSFYGVSIFFGSILILIGYLSYTKEIKKHFRFTYQNFGLLLFFFGCISAIFDSNFELLFALFSLVSSIFVSYFAWIKKEFLFFFYANITAYIAITFLMFSAVGFTNGATALYVYYFPMTCIGYIVFLFNKKSHFSND